MACMTDERRSAVLMGKRTHLDFRNVGVASSLVHLLFEHLQTAEANLTNVIRIRSDPIVHQHMESSPLGRLSCVWVSIAVT